MAATTAIVLVTFPLLAVKNNGGVHDLTAGAGSIGDIIVVVR